MGSDIMRPLSLGIGLVVLSVFGIPNQLSAEVSGEAIFQQRCSACHSTGSDRLVGPGLAGVTSRRDPAWLKRFIMAPDQVLASGDSIAAALFQEYGVAMPNLGTTDAEADALIAFLGGAAATGGERTQPETIPVATAEQILLGQDLFQGTKRLTNGGPTCNSCHEVTNDAVIGGGVLARELTTVFSRLGGPGVRAILGSPPFPVMQRAYQARPLTDPEVAALVGFLQQADADHALHQPRDYGVKLFGSGVIGALLLLMLYSFLWRGRSRGAVHQAIYDRQISST